MNKINISTFFKSLFRLPKTKDEYHIYVKIMLLIASSFMIIGIINFLAINKEEEDMKSFCNFLNQDIQEISIFEKKELIQELFDHDEISGFQKAITDIEEWKPNHPIIVKSFDLNMTNSDGDKEKIQIVFLKSVDDVAYIYYNNKYTFKSKAVYFWLIQQI